MSKKSKVFIGIPVYNGGKFLDKCISSILSQTYTNFEVLISDNNSTDSTPTIIKKFQSNDSRIKYVKHEYNMGAERNFQYILENACGDYFLFAAVDNYFGTTFLEKTVQILDTNKDVVGCISKLKIDEKYVDPYKKEKDLLKKFGIRFRPLKTIALVGKYENRVKLFVKNWQWEMFYSVFRLEERRKSAIPMDFTGFDGAWILNILKYGQIHVLDEILFFSFPHGESSKGLLYLAKKSKFLLGRIIPFYPLTKWCFMNLGWKNFLKNFVYFIRLNFDGFFLVMISLYQSRKTIKKNH